MKDVSIKLRPATKDWIVQCPKRESFPYAFGALCAWRPAFCLWCGAPLADDEKSGHIVQRVEDDDNG